MVGLVTEITGKALTVTVLEAVLVHPPASAPVTLYVVVMTGEAEIVLAF